MARKFCILLLFCYSQILQGLELNYNSRFEYFNILDYKSEDFDISAKSYNYLYEVDWSLYDLKGSIGFNEVVDNISINNPLNDLTDELQYRGDDIDLNESSLFPYISLGYRDSFIIINLDEHFTFNLSLSHSFNSIEAGMGARRENLFDNDITFFDEFTYDGSMLYEEINFWSKFNLNRLSLKPQFKYFNIQMDHSFITDSVGLRGELDHCIEVNVEGEYSFNEVLLYGELGVYRFNVKDSISLVYSKMPIFYTESIDSFLSFKGNVGAKLNRINFTLNGLYSEIYGGDFYINSFPLAYGPLGYRIINSSIPDIKLGWLEFLSSYTTDIKGFNLNLSLFLGRVFIDIEDIDYSYVTLVNLPPIAVYQIDSGEESGVEFPYNHINYLKGNIKGDISMKNDLILTLSIEQIIPFLDDHIESFFKRSRGTGGGSSSEVKSGGTTFSITVSKSL